MVFISSSTIRHVPWARHGTTLSKPTVTGLTIWKIGDLQKLGCSITVVYCGQRRQVATNTLSYGYEPEHIYIYGINIYRQQMERLHLTPCLQTNKETKKQRKKERNKETKKQRKKERNKQTE
jgi:hypothetical protein